MLYNCIEDIEEGSNFGNGEGIGFDVNIEKKSANDEWSIKFVVLFAIS